ncbi:MAG: hypothetical protein ACXU9K_02485 [Thermodesulfobacteriota bacterium]
MKDIKNPQLSTKGFIGSADKRWIVFVQKFPIFEQNLTLPSFTLVMDEELVKAGGKLIDNQTPPVIVSPS